MPIVRFRPSIFGFPEKLLTKLRYCDYKNLTSTAGALNKYFFNWNSTFDPDNSGGGHQPLYRDTYASIYDHYSVVSCLAKVRIDNPTSVGFIVGVVTDDDSSGSSTFQTLMEQSTADFDTLTPLTGSHSSIEFTRNWDCESVLGIDPYASETYKTAVGSDPTELSTLIVYSIPVDGVSTGTLSMIIELEFTVLWTELTTPTQS